MKGDTRSIEQIKFHYEVEKRLSGRLRAASSAERATLYSKLYDELFQTVEHHPQLQRQANPDVTWRRTARQFSLLKAFIGKDDVYCEIGAGDCALSVKVAKHVRQVFAIEVSKAISGQKALPGNLELIISDGVSIPITNNSVDIFYSNQLMEHLHPDDAEIQVANVFRSLRPGGKYICITPNSLYGPHDSSRCFDREPTGFHLKEYTNSELRSLFSRIGFRRFRAIVSYQKIVLPWMIPLIPVYWAEKFLALLPYQIRKKLSYSLAAIKFVAIK